MFFGWIAAAGINIGVLYGLYDTPTMDPNVEALYICMHRFAWSIGCAWVVLACATGNGGINTAITAYFISPWTTCLFILRQMA